jgi:hypothetical protein
MHIIHEVTQTHAGTDPLQSHVLQPGTDPAFFDKSKNLLLRAALPPPQPIEAFSNSLSEWLWLPSDDGNWLPPTLRVFRGTQTLVATLVGKRSPSFWLCNQRVQPL